MDFIFNYEDFKNIVDELGWNGLLKHLQELCPQFKLCSTSQAWYEDSKYILKARGTYGDVIIRWK